MTLKAFVIGLPKCGTTTLHQALVQSGWTSVHWELRGRPVGEMIYERYFRNEDPLADLSDTAVIAQADFISHDRSFWPQMDPGLLASVRNNHPNCTFILNYRDPERAADSMCRWRDFQDRLVKMGAPGLPPGFAQQKRNIVQWIENHYALCRELFGSRGHFFEYDIEDEDAPNIIQRELGIDLTWWGRANENPTAA